MSAKKFSTWEKITPDPSDPAYCHWISGIYKIQFYDAHSGNKGKPAYAAYLKPPGWAYWGKFVDPSTPFYQTLEEAQQACRDHAERGDTP